MSGERINLIILESCLAQSQFRQTSRPERQSAGRMLVAAIVAVATNRSTREAAQFI